MSLDRLRADQPDVWLSQMLKEHEDERHNKNKDIVRALLIKNNAEDLIPMLLEDNG